MSSKLSILGLWDADQKHKFWNMLCFFNDADVFNSMAIFPAFLQLSSQIHKQDFVSLSQQCNPSAKSETYVQDMHAERYVVCLFHCEFCSHALSHVSVSCTIHSSENERVFNIVVST